VTRVPFLYAGLVSLTLLGGLGATTSGCSSDPEPVAEEAEAKPVQEPRDDRAPPLSALRPKVLPGESFDSEDEDD
jgi:hypothetical protein